MLGFLTKRETPRGLAEMSCLAVLLLVFPASSRAAPVSGTLNIRGSVTLSTTTIDFLPAGGGIGSFLVDQFTQTGDFVPLAGTSGTLKDLTAPVGTPFTLTGFLILAANPDISFTLTFIEPGVFPAASCAVAPAAGQTCTLPGSAFNLANTTSTSSVLSFTMRGTATRISTGETTPFVGTLTTQFSGLSYQSILATIGASGSVSGTYSADFKTAPVGLPTDTPTATVTPTNTPTSTLTSTPISTPTTTQNPTPLAIGVPTLDESRKLLFGLLVAGLGLLLLLRRR